MFHQPDLFEKSRPRPAATCLPELVDRISAVTRRPRYALLVLQLIAQEAGANGSIGPYVQTQDGRVPVRDWLCRALAPLAKRDCRRLALVEAVRSEIMARADQQDDQEELDRAFDEQLEVRILRSGRTSISRAVSDLVRAGLLQRHYQGYRVDHPNRGAQREAVYTITPDVRGALSRH